MNLIRKEFPATEETEVKFTFRSDELQAIEQTPLFQRAMREAHRHPNSIPAALMFYAALANEIDKKRQRK